MPTLDDYSPSEYLRLLCMGDSGTGKTGALESLVRAGYKLRILDLDNGVQPLATFLRHKAPDEATAHKWLKMVDVVHCRRDSFKATPSGPELVRATAMSDAMKALTRWPSDDSIPAEWGEDTILVIDSFTMLGQAAFNQAKFTNPGAKEPRTWFYSGQQMLESIISMLTAPSFHTNVIINCHVRFVETQDGITKGYPTALGAALSKEIPKYFSNLVLFETSGRGEKVKRQITTVPTAVIDLKNSAPFKLDKFVPIDDGLAQIFQTLKEA